MLLLYVNKFHSPIFEKLVERYGYVVIFLEKTTSPHNVSL